MKSLSTLIRVNLVLAVLLGAPGLLDAILVAPHALFMDSRNRTAEITLMNTGTTPEEVQIDLRYGYPASDSAGNVFIHFPQEIGEDEPNAAAFVRAFPRRLIITPGQRQTIRLLASPPAGLEDREYWSRVIVSARGANVSVAGGDEAVSAGITIQIQTVISLVYRQGEVQTGVDMNRFSMDVENDSLVLWVGFEREGNAAYLGQIELEMRDVSGDSTAAAWATPIAVYKDLTRRYAFSVEHLEPGEYAAIFNLTTRRPDLPDQSVVLPVDSIYRSTGVEVLPR